MNAWVSEPAGGVSPIEWAPGAGTNQPVIVIDQALNAFDVVWAGTPLHIVAHRLGHRDPMVTAKTYAHIDADQAINVSLAFAKAVE
jgi:hypothetical protein